MKAGISRVQAWPGLWDHISNKQNEKWSGNKGVMFSIQRKPFITRKTI